MLNFGMPTLIEIPSPEESAKLCSRLGLSFFEINMSFPQYQPESMDIERLLAIKEKYGIYYTVHLDEILDVCSPNKRIAQVYLETVLQTIEIAKKLAIPVLNMHLLRGVYVTLPDRRTYIYAENESLFLDSLRRFRDRVTEAIGGKSIKICVENTDGYDLPFLRRGLETLLESPAFALTFDIGHDYAIGCADKPLILAHGERLAHMHMHDGEGARVHLALGDGNMDIPEYLRLAETHSCRVLLETKTVAALEQSVKYVNRWLNGRSCPDELWDALDENGEKLGRLHRRGDKLGNEEYHRVIHAWHTDGHGNFLITKRSPNKSWGGCWECTGGSVLAGESSLNAAIRETREETGFELNPENGTLLLSYRCDHYFCDVWVFRQDFELADAVLQEGETSDAKKVTAQELMAMQSGTSMVKYDYLAKFIDEML